MSELTEQDAEIKRLRAMRLKEYLKLDEKLERALRKNESLATLITELADALEDYAFSPEDEHPGRWDMNLLIQRAREATKCQP
jgi:hypothetical protein